MAEKMLILDPRELHEICSHFGLDSDEIGVTGALVEVGDGDYTSCELTMDSKPYLVDAVYRDVYAFVLAHKLACNPIVIKIAKAEDRRKRARKIKAAVRKFFGGFWR